MSLDVSPALLAQAEAGAVEPEAFLGTVRSSLPYAYAMVERLAAQAASDPAAAFADNVVAPGSEAERGQLLRALASDAIRGSLERHFGVTLAFQNCHRLAVFPAGARAEAGAGASGAEAEAYLRFTSERAQLLNQSPELRDC